MKWIRTLNYCISTQVYITLQLKSVSQSGSGYKTLYETGKSNPFRKQNWISSTRFNERDLATLEAIEYQVQAAKIEARKIKRLYVQLKKREREAKDGSTKLVMSDRVNKGKAERTKANSGMKYIYTEWGKWEEKVSEYPEKLGEKFWMILDPRTKTYINIFWYAWRLLQVIESNAQISNNICTWSITLYINFITNNLS